MNYRLIFSSVFVIFLLLSSWRGEAQGFDQPDWDAPFLDRDALMLEAAEQKTLVAALCAVAANFPESSWIDQDGKEKALFLALTIDPLDRSARTTYRALIDGTKPPRTPGFTKGIREVADALWTASERMLKEPAEPEAVKLAGYVGELSLAVHPAPTERRIRGMIELQKGRPPVTWSRYVDLQPGGSVSSRRFENLMKGGRSSSPAVAGLVSGSRVIEAEDARLTKCRVAKTHGGYSGTGFVEIIIEEGASVQFSVDVPEGRKFSAGIRYAAGSHGPAPPRNLSVYVNGKKVGRLQAKEARNWRKWETQALDLNLEKGKNSIVFQFDPGDTGWINLDCLTLE